VQKEWKMPKRCRLKQLPKAAALADAAARLRKALARCTKAELVDLLVEFAREDQGHSFVNSSEYRRFAS